MTCEMTRERLWAWIQAETDEVRQHAPVAEHVEGCVVCKTAVRAMRELLGDVKSCTAPEPATLPLTCPAEIGGYRIIRLLGEGGMGVVFEAEQRNPRRRVALKVIRGGAVLDGYRARLFQREAQTLARLNHPNIAAIYEAGTTDSGQQYFAMELVEGASLLEFAADRAAAGRVTAQPNGLRDRLRLFCSVTDAIRYAHQRGVVHRDLKPANVVVSDAGTPKVLDFGLARLLEPDDEPGGHTESGRVVGTFAYMSPEQARGETAAIDTRTDVYALGVVLYELLTGRTPYEFSGASTFDAIRTICEQRPTPPRQFDPGIPADVETIVLKAIEKEPPRRYESAAALGEDVRRFLGGFPVRARPAGRLYQFRRLIGRHRLVSSLLSLLLLSLLTFGAVSAWQAARIAGERDRAQREARTVRQINDVLVSLLESADPWQEGDREITVLEVLGQNASRVEAELADAPLIAAAVNMSLAQAYRSFSAYDAAERLLRAALAQRRQVLGEAALEVGDCLNALGELLYLKGDAPGAEALLQRGLQIRRQHLPTGHEQIAQSLNNLSLARARLDDLSAAEEYARAALAIRDRLVAAVEADPSASQKRRRAVHNDYAQTLNNLAGIVRRAADGDRLRLHEARRLYEAALDKRVRWLGENHPDVAKMHNNYARLLQSLDELVPAQQHFRESLRILRAGLGADHQFIARAQRNLADVLLQGGELAAAEAECTAALQMQERLSGIGAAEIGQTRSLLRRIQMQRSTQSRPAGDAGG